MSSIEGLLGELGIKYYVMTDEALGDCPFHADGRHQRTNSWSVNVNTGQHYCFACGVGGSFASLVMRRLGIPYADAVAWVNSRAGMSRAGKWLEKRSEVQDEPVTFDDSDLALFTSPPESALAGRKITAEAAAKYEVMWNDKTSSWIFPIRSPDGLLLGWQEKNEHRFRNYPAGVRKSETLFGLGATGHGSRVILVESPVDAVRCCSSGAGTGLSSYGVRVSGKQLTIIHSIGSALVLALDNDLAGMEETARICRDFKQLPVRVFNYGELKVKDIGDMTDEQIRWGVGHAVSAIYYR
jgi:CHC2 zinc finger/Toprim-like